MNQREAESADVRPFLPRPGEPVEEYAERLRAMHRDLSVVLQAVERGLQRAHAPAEAETARPAEEQVAVHVVEEPAEQRLASSVTQPSAAAMREPLRGAPRVEVVSTHAGHRAGDETVESPWAEGEPVVDRRAPVEPLERHGPSPRPDDPRWARAAPAPPFAERPSADPLHVPPPPAQPPLAERPSADPRYSEARPAWGTAPVTVQAVEPVAAPAPAPAPSAPEPRPVVVPTWAIAASLVLWLTIVGLLLTIVIQNA
jgi:hypothetical protein